MFQHLQSSDQLCASVLVSVMFPTPLLLIFSLSFTLLVINDLKTILQGSLFISPSKLVSVYCGSYLEIHHISCQSQLPSFLFYLLFTYSRRVFPI